MMCERERFQIVRTVSALFGENMQRRFGRQRLPKAGAIRRRADAYSNHELVEFAFADMSNKLFVARHQVGLREKREIEEFFVKGGERARWPHESRRI